MRPDCMGLAWSAVAVQGRGPPVFVETSAANRSSPPAEVWPWSNSGNERKASDDASVTPACPCLWGEVDRVTKA